MKKLNDGWMEMPVALCGSSREGEILARQTVQLLSWSVLHSLHTISEPTNAPTCIRVYRVRHMLVNTPLIN
jgi:hypothetical protein